jgi:hypothetical protein
MKAPFRLVQPPACHDTVKALAELLEDAQNGHLIGVAFCAMYKRREFIVGTTGEADRSPVFTRGMLACLDDKLRC